MPRQTIDLETIERECACQRALLERLSIALDALDTRSTIQLPPGTVEALDAAFDGALSAAQRSLPSTSPSALRA